MTAIEVVALQMAARPGDVDGNVEQFARLVRQHGEGVDLIVAPELMSSGYDLDVLAERGKELAEPIDGPTVSRALDLAAEVGATVAFGLLEADGPVLYDTVVIVGPDGTVTPYRKTHLYPNEVGLFTAGQELLVTSSAGARLGVMICFEHAFPDVATALALREAEILVIPSAVPIGYEYLLTLRTRARAQDNQVFAIGCNLTGGGFCGRSLVVDPRGDILASAGTEETALRATLDLDAIGRERQREPALRFRRPDLYHDARG